MRQIAESVGSGDRGRIARTVVVLRRISLLLGILGAAILAAFASEVSTVTFGSDQHAEGVALLSLVVLFRLISAGQGALLQGMRRIRDLAASGVLGTSFGAVVSIAFVYFWGEPGVVPSLAAGAAMGVVLSWWYCRARSRLSHLTWREPRSCKRLARSSGSALHSWRADS